MSEKYDSREDTNKHIERVSELIGGIRDELALRGTFHDASKTKDPEKPIFDEVTPLLRGMTYGSEEYKESIAKMKPALDHHYGYNRHHPEHFENGIMDMNLIDILEMLADWKAAGERHADGCIERSLEVNEERFQIPEALIIILKNTVNELGWGKTEKNTIGELLGDLYSEEYRQENK